MRSSARWALLAALLLAVLPAAPSAANAVPEPGEDAADYVLLIGIAGLRWDDISPQHTPALWRLAEQGAIGTLSVRSAHAPTCPADGWVTLGAGNYAERTSTLVEEQCPPVEVVIERPDQLGAYLPDQQAVVARQQELRFGAIPGALAESVRCTAAVSPGAAIAAARPFGRVDRYADELPEAESDLAELLSSCVLTIVDLGAVTGATPELRAQQATAADTRLARVVAGRPEQSTVIVAGLSDTSVDSRLHAVVVDGPGWEGAWLTSPTTGRDGYLQLVDLAPTALRALGRTLPDRLFAGNPATAVQGRPDDLTSAIADSADADRQAAAAGRVAGWFFGLLAVVQIGLCLAVIPLLRRSYRHAGPSGPALPSPRIVQITEALLIAAALAVPAALLAHLVPWWRSGQRGLLFAVVTLGVLALLTSVVLRTPGVRTLVARHSLGPLGVICALAALIVGGDVLTGAHLQLNGVAGYSGLAGGRTAGMAVVPLGVFAAGVFGVTGCLVSMRRGPARRHWLGFAVAGAAAIVVTGSPFLGNDAGAAVALVAGASLAAAMSAGGWLSFTRLAWATLAGLTVTVVLAMLDIARPVPGGMGRFLLELADGSYPLTLRRVGWSNVVAFATSPLTILAVATAVFGWSALMRPWGGLKRLFGIYPAVRAAMAGTALATVLAGIAGGAGLKVAGAAAATLLPLLTLTALRVLGHAADRTRAQVLE